MNAFLQRGKREREERKGYAKDAAEMHAHPRSSCAGLLIGIMFHPFIRFIRGNSWLIDFLAVL
jgi:hypothetical protein